MEREYRYLLHLLAAYLCGEKPKTADEIDWNILIRLAQIHKVAGILGYMGKKYPICPDGETKALLRSLCLTTVSVYTQKYAMAEAVASELEKNGIDHILMKGYELREFYPVPELRTFNDIDIVIRPQDRQRTHSLMLELGCHVHTDWEPVYTYILDGAMYEIHTDIMEIDVSDRADYRGYFQKMWDYARPVRPHSCRFTPEFHFLYLLAHIAKHVRGSGAGIRMYLDVAAFIRHYGDTVDWGWIRDQLTELKLDEFSGVVLTAAEKWFGVPAPMAYEKVSDEVMVRFLAYTMEAGIFGHYHRDTALTTLKYADPAEGGTRLHRVLRKTFPKAETIQSRYTYLQDKPWLLPAAWVHRLIKNREKLGQRTREMGQIITADSEKVQKMQKLMKEIGL